MQTTITITQRCCHQAVVQFGNQLARAGLPVKRLPQRDKDAVCFEWGWGHRETSADWELENEPADDLEARRPLDDGGLGRLVEHYSQNLRLLGCAPTLARSWLQQHGANS